MVFFSHAEARSQELNPGLPCGVTRAQTLEPSPLYPMICSRELDSVAEPGIKPRHLNMGPTSLNHRLNARPRVSLEIDFSSVSSWGRGMRGSPLSEAGSLYRS